MTYIDECGDTAASGIAASFSQLLDMSTTLNRQVSDFDQSGVLDVRQDIDFTGDDLPTLINDDESWNAEMCGGIQQLLSTVESTAQDFVTLTYTETERYITVLPTEAS